MAGKLIYEGASPKTQSTEAVQARLKFYNHNQDVTELPLFYRLSSEMVLVRSNKGDVYYVTTSKACSCPAATYHPGQACKHQRKYFPQQTREACEEPAEGALRLAQPPKDSIKPEGKWAGGHNGPVDDFKGAA